MHGCLLEQDMSVSLLSLGLEAGHVAHLCMAPPWDLCSWCSGAQNFASANVLQAGALDKLEGFASHHGPDFYGLPRNSGKVTLVRQPLTIPEEYTFGTAVVVPMWAGQEIGWTVVTE